MALSLLGTSSLLKSLDICNTMFYSKGMGVAHSGLFLQRNMKHSLPRDIDPIMQEQSFPVDTFRPES